MFPTLWPRKPGLMIRPDQVCGAKRAPKIIRFISKDNNQNIANWNQANQVFLENSPKEIALVQS